SHAMVGYASFKDGDNRFLETRIRRDDGALLPEETAGVVGDDGARSLVDAFRIMSGVGRDVVRIVTAASSSEAGSFVVPGSVVSAGEDGAPSIAGLTFEDAEVSGLVDEGDGPSEEDRRRGDVLASEAAALMTDEIMDDGAPLGEDSPIDRDEGPVSMSPHRLCRYSNDAAKGKRGILQEERRGRRRRGQAGRDLRRAHRHVLRDDPQGEASRPVPRPVGRHAGHVRVELPVPSGHARGAPAAVVEEQRPRGRAPGRRGVRPAEAQRACAPEGEAGDEDGRGAVPRRRRGDELLGEADGMTDGGRGTRPCSPRGRRECN
ncbi:hypothetical protein THAOC_12028, partial [Thalassiosira oceanica]